MVDAMLSGDCMVDAGDSAFGVAPLALLAGTPASFGKDDAADAP